MKVTDFLVYRDGGTIKITTDEGEYCYDGRIGSKTKGQLFLGYPLEDNSNRIADTSHFNKKITDALHHYHDPGCDSLIKKIIKHGVGSLY